MPLMGHIPSSVLSRGSPVTSCRAGPRGAQVADASFDWSRCERQGLYEKMVRETGI